MKFEKDAWIKRALEKKALHVRKTDGAIFRVSWKNGQPKLSRVKFSTHKKTQRVYFNFTFEGVTKSVLVNRVVGIACHPNPLNLAEVNHKDGNKANNHPDNLEWSDRSEQEKHAFATGLKSGRGSQNSNSKLTADEVVRMRAAWEGGSTTKALAQVFKVSPATVNGIVRYKTWKHL